MGLNRSITYQELSDFIKKEAPVCTFYLDSKSRRVFYLKGIKDGVGVISLNFLNKLNAIQEVIGVGFSYNDGLAFKIYLKDDID